MPKTVCHDEIDQLAAVVFVIDTDGGKWDGIFFSVIVYKVDRAIGIYFALLEYCSHIFQHLLCRSRRFAKHRGQEQD